jgi:hypothetical protein
VQRRSTKSVSGRGPGESYCRRLVAELCQTPNRIKIPEFRRKQLKAVSSMVTDEFFDGSPSPEAAAALAEKLASHPRLQAYLAAFTTYTPSKWLLEQELSARQSNESFESKAAVSNSASPEGPLWESSWNGDSDVYLAAGEQALVGLCLSGGGVRSATFNLGVLQGLASRGLLTHIDYLSSVSGGGYIHQWFAAWVLRSRECLAGVQQKLKPQPVEGSPARAPDPIFWLRRYASYLTPQRGVFSADTWTMIALWFRNTLLNQIVLFSFMGLVLFLFHFLLPHQSTSFESRSFEIGKMLSERHPQHIHVVHLLLAILIAASGIWVAIQIAQNFFRERDLKRRDELLDNSAVVWLLVFPCLLLALATTFLLASGASPAHIAFGAGMYFAVVSFVVSFASLFPPRRTEDVHPGEALLIIFGALAAAATAAFLVYLVAISLFQSQVFKDLAGQIGLFPLQLVIAPALLYSTPFLAVNLQLGILGRSYIESRREWIARLRAWTVLVSFSWIALFAISLLGPPLIHLLILKGLHSKMTWGAMLTFVGSHAAALYSGASKKTDGNPSDKGYFGYRPLDWLGILAAPVAILTLLVAISFVLQLGVDKTAWLLGSMPSWLLRFVPFHFLGNSWFVPILLLLLAVLGTRVDANEFSMHGFYRNRLSRCYLGASLEDRRPNPFTGFDERSEVLIGGDRVVHDPRVENIHVSDLLPQRFQRTLPPDDQSAPVYTGPFPIFSCTLNLTFGQDLAYQERKGASFAFTPLYSGYHVGWTAADKIDDKQSFNGFVPTKDYAYPDGVPLPTAAAISGAAMSPNQGFSTKPSLAFLMTLFNVRLGWWIANTRRSDAWPECKCRPAPRMPLLNLLKELFGAADDSNDFIYLNDGGKFDNMGLYELVRRRCRFIIISDAEQDGDLSFDGIAMAIRKCRTDFGAEVTLDLKAIKHRDEKTKRSDAHFAIGTIRYPAPPSHKGPEGKLYEGIVVYLKSSLTGDEPADVLSYALEHGAFPHDMTANQWFTESQFESYRRLGQHIVSEIFPDQSSPANRAQVQEIFGRLLPNANPSANAACAFE